MKRKRAKNKKSKTLFNMTNIGYRCQSVLGIYDQVVNERNLLPRLRRMNEIIPIEKSNWLSYKLTDMETQITSHTNTHKDRLRSSSLCHYHIAHFFKVDLTIAFIGPNHTFPKQTPKTIQTTSHKGQRQDRDRKAVASKPPSFFHSPIVHLVNSFDMDEKSAFHCPR